MQRANAYFLGASKADIKSLHSSKQMSPHQDQVQKRHQVIECVIKVIEVISEQSLRYQAQRFETACDLIMRPLIVVTYFDYFLESMMCVYKNM